METFMKSKVKIFGSMVSKPLVYGISALLVYGIGFLAYKKYKK